MHAAVEEPVVATCIANALRQGDVRATARDLCSFASVSRDARFCDALRPWLRAYRIMVCAMNAARAAHADREALTLMLRNPPSPCGAVVVGRALESASSLRRALLRVCAHIDDDVGLLSRAQWAAQRDAARLSLARLARVVPRGERRRVHASLRRLGSRTQAGGAYKLLDDLAHPW